MAIFSFAFLKKRAFAIDLNLDAGEDSEALRDGREERLYALVSSVNIACGGHAGDRDSMKRSVELALKHQLAIGAHPSYPDREGFGRRVLNLPSMVLMESLVEQILNLQEVVSEMGSSLSHVKPHGALYNQAAVDESLAVTVLDAVKNVDAHLPVVGLARSKFIDVCRAKGQVAIGEGFVDRRYQPDGTLVPRSVPGAVISEPEIATQQALDMVKGKFRQSYQTLCIHGDTEKAYEIAKAVRDGLSENKIRIEPASGAAT